MSLATEITLPPPPSKISLMTREVINNGSSSDSSYEKSLVKQLRKLAQANPHMDTFLELFDDRFLLHFIRGKKFNLDKSYACLQHFIEVRQGREKYLFKEMRPSNCTRFYTGITTRACKYKDHLNRLVIVHQPRFWKTEVSDSDDTLKMFIMGAEEVWNSDDAELNGVVFINDMAGCNFKQFRAATPTLVYRLISIMLTGFPMRVQRMHLVNGRDFFTVTLKAIRSLFPKKFKDRLFVHGHNLASLHDHIPVEILPESLGGTLSAEDCFDNEWESRIIAKEEYYQKFAEYNWVLESCSCSHTELKKGKEYGWIYVLQK